MRKTETRVIMKLQRPLTPGDGAVLCYDRDREYVLHIPMTDHLRMLFSDRYKLYAWVKILPGKNIFVDRVLGELGW